MTKIIPRNLIKHLEWNPKQATAPVVNTPTKPVNTSQGIDFSKNPNESFIMSYDGIHGEYFQELISKVNETYAGTKAEIPTGTSGEIQGHLIKRLGLITTIYDNSNLRSAGLHPITPEQSEYLLQADNLTTPGDNWEDLAMVLYDLSQNGNNSKEAQAIYNSLKDHRQDLGLSKSDLEKKLVIVNAGIEVDKNMNYGVKPIILPGLTQVYTHEVLEKVGEDFEFEGYGLDKGLPLLNQLGDGNRTLYMPDETEDIGLRVLYRDGGLDLSARSRYLSDSDSDGRVNFAQSAST